MRKLAHLGALSAWGLVQVSLTPLGANPAAAATVFTDVTAAAGVSYVQMSYPATCYFAAVSCEPERMTGGAAVADVNADGHLDLFVTRFDDTDILFLNQGNGTFTDGTVDAGLGGPGVFSNGAGFADVDNDGDPDLYVTVMGLGGDPVSNRNRLFINDGTGHFTDEAVARGAAIASPGWRMSESVAFGDFDRDGWLDIHVTEWFPPSSNARLLRNLGPAMPGHFVDVTAAAGVDLSSVHGFASSFTDLDGDGWPELVVAADFGTSRLFWNDGDGTFSDGTVAAGVGSDENGMGSTLGDFDGDGDLDWFVTSIYDPADTCSTNPCSWGNSGNRLFRNEGSRVFADATDFAGVRNGHWGWGASFFDYDNDGDLDLTMTNGVDFPDTAIETPFYTDPMRFWENDGTGVMTEKSATLGVTDTGLGKGLLVFDYDADGDLDLFVANNGGAPRLYRNDGGNANDWLRVRAVGMPGTNHDGIGAIVRLRATAGSPVQVREIGTATHFLAQSESVAHFGLGPAAGPVFEVEVTWPASGGTSYFSSVAPNATLLAEACADELTIDQATVTGGTYRAATQITAGPMVSVDASAQSVHFVAGERILFQGDVAISGDFTAEVSTSPCP